MINNFVMNHTIRIIVDDMNKFGILLDKAIDLGFNYFENIRFFTSEDKEKELEKKLIAIAQ